MKSFSKSEALLERAMKTIPWGIPGHQNPALQVPGQNSCFTQKAEGCRFWDVDGNEYIDYMCAYGPMILGYGNPKVEEAVLKQKNSRDLVTLPNPVMIELAEKFVGLVPSADWVLYGKNGTDVVEQAVRVARAHTQKSKIMMAEGTYHGISPWCTPVPLRI